jgi:iron complex outermembrane receptor protein
MFKPTRVQLAIGALLGAAAAPTQAQSSPEPTIQRVEITGSSIKRIDAETALPVQVLTRRDIERSGVTSVEQLLQTLTSAASMGGTIGATGAGMSTYGLSSISLRGLGEERTLVLVNGRRLAPFASGGGATVNVNAIPLSAIERVEVLKDGASSVYGSDAVAGVVNFILSKSFQGVELSTKLGTPTRSGGGQTAGAAVVVGFGDLDKDRFNLTLTASVERDKSLASKDRGFARTGNVPPFLDSGATGQGNIEGAYTPGNGTPYTPAQEATRPQAGFGASPGSGYGNPLAASGQCASINMYQSPFTTSKGAPFCSFDSSAFLDLLPEREMGSLTANLAFRLTPQHELFSDLLFSRSENTIVIQPSPLRRSFLITDNLFAQQGVDPVLVLRPNNPNYAIAADYLNAQGLGSIVGQPLAVTARVFDFGQRGQKSVADQWRLVSGLRGSLLGQDYEVALSHNESKMRETLPSGYFSQVAFARVVNAPDSDYNPWSLTQSDEFNRRLAAANVQYTGESLRANAKSTGVDAKITGEAFAAGGGMSQYAAGVHYRTENYVLDPSAAYLTGDIAGLGGAQPGVDVKRKIASAFAELSVPLMKTLEANASVRYDKYSVIGNATTYKSSLRWAPSKSVVVRASLGTGFRAPTLEDLYEPQTLGTSEQFTDPGTGETNLQVPSVTGGNPNLKPEKSRQRSIGIVLSPNPQTTIGIDWFGIKMTDTILEPTAQMVVSRFRAGDPAYADQVTLDDNGDIASIRQNLQNTGALDVAGIDVDLKYRMPLASSRVDFSFNGTYMLKFNETTPSGAISRKVGTVVDPEGSPVIGADEGGVVLRWKHVLSATWVYGPWSFTAAQNFAKGYEDGRRQLDGERHFVPSFATYDAQVGYEGFHNLRLALGVRNLFDKDPPLHVPASNQFQSGYDVTQYDPRSRFVYVSAAYRF